MHSDFLQGRLDSTAKQNLNLKDGIVLGIPITALLSGDMMAINKKSTARKSSPFSIYSNQRDLTHLSAKSTQTEAGCGLFSGISLQVSLVASERP